MERGDLVSWWEYSATLRRHISKVGILLDVPHEQSRPDGRSDYCAYATRVLTDRGLVTLWNVTLENV